MNIAQVPTHGRRPHRPHTLHTSSAGRPPARAIAEPPNDVHRSPLFSLFLAFSLPPEPRSVSLSETFTLSLSPSFSLSFSPSLPRRRQSARNFTYMCARQRTQRWPSPSTSSLTSSGTFHGGNDARGEATFELSSNFQLDRASISRLEHAPRIL